jgi:hypothetical protein
MKLDPNKKYTVFDRVSFEQRDWVGYNAELLDELVSVGNNLIHENEKLKKNKRETKIIDMSFIPESLGIGFIILIVGFVIGIIGASLKEINLGEHIKKAYRQGQYDVLSEENIVYEFHPTKGMIFKENIDETKAYSFTAKDGKVYNFYYEE